MQSRKSILWSIGAGKGGVGKTFLTASFGVALARMGKSVVAVDAAIGCPSLHTCLGIKSPRATLLDHFRKQATEDEVLIPTCQSGLKLLSCAGDVLGAADLAGAEKQEILRFIDGLQADCVLIDVGPGTSANVLDFFNRSPQGIVVVTPEPGSMQNAFVFIKNAVYRCIRIKFESNVAVHIAFNQLHEDSGNSKPVTMMDFYDILCTSDPEVAEAVAAMVDSYHPLIIINMAASEEDQRVAEMIQSACKKYLNVDIRFCGLVFSDPAIPKAIQKMAPLDFDDPAIPAAQQIQQTLSHLLSCSGETRKSVTDCREDLMPATPVMGLNDNLEFMGHVFHIQTEDVGYTGRCISTQVFFNGKVVLSTKSQYPSTVRGPGDRMQVTVLMRTQHFNVLRELECRKVRILQATQSS